MRSGPEEKVNRGLHRRIELLETRFVPAWEPLRIVVMSLPSNYVLGPGERLVEDELLEGQDRKRPLMLTVNERITTDPKDHGKRWSDQQ
jgi:hypothetical protein